MWYNKNGNPAPKAIKVKINGVNTWKCDPASDLEWRNSNGYIYPEPPISEEKQSQIEEQSNQQILLQEEFESACEQFRIVCTTIGSAIGDPSFKGGFEEMTKLQQSEVYNTIQGLQMANAWSAMNEYCKYLGAKLGYGQPDWWKHCWEFEANNNANEGEE